MPLLAETTKYLNDRALALRADVQRCPSNNSHTMNEMELYW